jgi:hypothetical protein
LRRREEAIVPEELKGLAMLAMSRAWRRLVVAKSRLHQLSRQEASHYRTRHGYDAHDMFDPYETHREAVEQALKEDHEATQELIALGFAPPPSERARIKEEQAVEQKRLNEQWERQRAQPPPPPPPPPPTLPEPKGYGRRVWEAALTEKLVETQRDLLQMLTAWCDEHGRVKVKVADVRALRPYLHSHNFKTAWTRFTTLRYLRVIEGACNENEFCWTFQLEVPARTTTMPS